MNTALTLHATKDARWYTREDILAILSHPTGTTFSRRDYKVLNDGQDGTDKDTDQPQQGVSALAHSDLSITPKEGLGTKVILAESQPKPSNEEEPPFRVPPMTAIAGVLIRHWAEGKMQDNFASVRKGNL